MNKIFRKVWNKSLGQLVVASELARNNVDAASGASRRGSEKRVWLAMAVMAGSIAANPAIAGTCVQIDQIGSSSALGSGAAAAATCGPFSIAIGGGSGAIAQNISVAIGDAATAIGQDSVGMGRQTFVTGSSATGVGSQSRATAANASAFGQGANASAAQTVALGSGATAGNTGAVALGVNSVTAAAVATTNATIAGTVYTFAGTGPTSTISIGSTTNQRTLTNLAAGRLSATSTDGVNGSQLFATNSAVTQVGTNVTNLGTTVTNLGTTVTNLGTTVTNINNQGTKYFHANSTTADSVATGADAIAVGTGATASGSTSIAMGVTASSTAANAIAIGAGASSTFARATAIGVGSKAGSASSVAMGDGALTGTTGQNVAIGSGAKANSATFVGGAVAIGKNQLATGDGAVAIGDPNTANGQGAVALGFNNNANGQGAIAMGSTSAATGQGSVALGNASTAMAPGSLAFGDGATAFNARDVALGSGSATAIAAGTTGGTINGTTYSYAGTSPWSTVSVGAVGAERTITNVAAGRVTAASTDAINGSQLFATNTAVTALGTTVNNINNGSGIKYFHATSTLADSAAIGTDSVAIGPNALANNANDIALGAGSVTAVAVQTAGATIGGVAYAFAGVSPVSTVSVGSAGSERTITNVAAGQLSATSTDAVNGSQLFATNQQVTTNTTDIANNTTAINNINNGAGIKYFHANSTGADSVASGTDSVAIGVNAVAGNANDVALGAGSVTSAVVATTGATINGTAYTYAGAAPTSTVSVGSAGNERTIANVAAGQVNASSTDAVNGSQLYATNQAVELLDNAVSGGAGIKYFHANSNLADSQAAGTDSVAIGPAAVATNAGDIALGAGSVSGSAAGVSSVLIGGLTFGGFAGAAPASVVSVGSAGNERQIQNVAAGRVTSVSTDAINGSQLYSVADQLSTLNSSVNRMGTAIQQNAATPPVAAAAAGAVQYDKNIDGSINSTSITLNPGGGDPAAIHNVAAGVAGHDAVNVDQLNAGINTAQNWAKDYADQRFQAADQRINTVNNRANAGIASAMAMAGLPQAYEPGRNMAAVAAGSYRGESGLAIGVSMITESGRWVYKLTGSTDTRGDAGVTIGAGMQW